MIRARGLILATGVVTLMTIGGIDGGPAAGQSSGRLDLLCQSHVVGDEQAIIDLRITDPPDDAIVVVNIQRPATIREELRETFDDPPARSPADDIAFFSETLTDGIIDGIVDDSVPIEGEPPPTDPGCADPETEDRHTIRVRDDEVGELLRLAEGALPVVISLRDGGTTIDSLVTHLLVIPPADDTSSVRLSFVGDVRTELALGPDQAIDAPTATLARALPDLAGLPTESLALSFRPETLDALASVGDDETLDAILDAARDRTIFLEPWVELDEEAWRAAGEGDMVIAQYARGRATTEDILDIAPSPIVRLDNNATAATVGLIRAAGATNALIEPDAVRRSTVEAADDRPIQVLDDNDVPMSALLIDTELAETLADVDPELGAHRALAELSLIGLGADDDRAVVVDVETIAPVTIDRLIDLIDTRDELVLSPLPELYETPPSRDQDDRIVEARLTPAAAVDLTDAAAELREARADVDAFATVVTTTDAPIAPLRTLLFASADVTLDDDARRTYTDAVAEAIQSGTAGIRIVESGRITLASRTADLPLTVINGQSIPMMVDLVLRAEKLRFPDGDRRTIQLDPGVNLLTVRVETRASGDARVTAMLVSPDGRLELDSAVVPIRSTALSGIGLLISGAAITVLIVWWIRTVRRTRRARGAATVPASADEVDSAPGEQVAGNREEP